MKKFLPGIFLTIFFIIINSSAALAVTTKIIDFPASISQDPFTVTASISGAASGTNYLRIDLYKDKDNPNYFGETYNGSDWYRGSDGSQYLPITIQKGVAWIGTVKGQFGLPSQTEYDGTGNYKLRLRRYTSSGGPGSYTSTEADESAVNINLVIPTSTPVLTVTPNPTDTPTPTNTPTSTPEPTSTVVPTKIPTTTIPTPSRKPTLKPTPTGKVKENKEITPSITVSPTIKKGEVKGSKTSSPFIKDLPKILILFGVLSGLAMVGTAFLSKKINK